MFPRLTVVIVFLFAAAVLGFSGAGLAHAEFFGITLDKTCLILLEQNLTSNCPTFEELNLLFPDSSNQHFSGGFVYKDGLWQRENKYVKNHFEYYRYSDKKHTVFIDPPADIMGRIKVIEIRADMATYKLPKNQGYDPEEHSLSSGVFRYVDGCQRAFIDSGSYLNTIGDTMYYLLKNCDESFTNLTTIEKTVLNRTEHDISTSYDWQLKQWIKENLEKCKVRGC